MTSPELHKVKDEENTTSTLNNILYYSARNLNSNDFGVFGINYQIRIQILSLRELFFEGFELLVCSCECAVACLYPHNSSSNVVVSLTIHDDMFMYVFIRDVCKNT